MQKSFSVKYRKQIEDGTYKLVTSKGKSARVVCWDMQHNDKNDIVVMVKSSDTGNETCNIYDENGVLTSNGKQDLFVVTDETKFKEGDFIILKEYGTVALVTAVTESGYILDHNKGYVLPFQIENNWEILENVPPIETILINFIKDDKLSYTYKDIQSVAERIRKIALADIPKWRKNGNSAFAVSTDGRKSVLLKEFFGGYHLSDCVGPNNIYIELSELEKLPTNDFFELGTAASYKAQKG